MDTDYFVERSDSTKGRRRLVMRQQGRMADRAAKEWLARRDSRLYLTVAWMENQYSGFRLRGTSKRRAGVADEEFPIGSISKKLTGDGLDRNGWRRGKLDLDARCKKYVRHFRTREPVITTRMSRELAGIRHYPGD